MGESGESEGPGKGRADGDPPEQDEQDEQEGTEDSARSPRDRLMETLHAFRASLEETIAEARERGDVSAEKAREMFRSAADRTRTATADARERFDFVTQAEFDDLTARVARLEARLGDSSSDSDAPAAEEPGPGGS